MIAAPARSLERATPAQRNAPMPTLSEHGLRAMMTSHVGVIRDGERLAQAVRAFAAIERDSDNIALRNMATTALLVATAAWARRESRGAHCRIDHPAELPALAHRTMTTLKAARDIADSLSEPAPVRSAQPIIA
jgi:L-aspartate oxidase